MMIRQRLLSFFAGSLRKRLIWAVALVHAVMMTLFVHDLTIRQREFLLESRTEEASNLANTLRLTVITPMLASDLAALQELSNAVAGYPGVTYVMIVHKTGKILAHSSPERRGQFAGDIELFPADTATDPVILSRTRGLVDVVAPIMAGKSRLGWVRIGVGQGANSSKLETITLTGVYYTALAILIGALLAWLMASRLTRRLSEMTRVADQVSLGDLTVRTEVQGSDELGHLARAFNYMLDALEQRTQSEHALQSELMHSHDALKTLASNLEQQVAARTAELKVALQKAEAGTQARSEFLANMSHEIRTPLNAIIGMVHVLRRGEVDAAQNDKLSKIENAGTHLLEVINDVLDLSKIEAGKLTIAEERLNVGAVIENVSSMISPRLKAKQLHYAVETDPLPEHVLGDQTRLQQALLNYLSNAAKFTETGSVTLRVRVEEEQPDWVSLRFEVSDTGPGISAEVLPRLFAIFEQADNSISRKYGGTGLGLAITRKIAQLMDGTTGVTTAPGEGSTFWLTVRLKRATSELIEIPPQPLVNSEQTLKRDFSGMRILLVDDEPINREVTLSLLENTGLVVAVAEDGEEALRLASEEDYALILMDMQMPNMDGLEATVRIRQRARAQHMPILAMTANAFVEDRARCLAAGMDDFITKPVNPETLFVKLANWLSHGRASAGT